MVRARGFTLIELLIVVTIIGIIAAIAIPNLMNALDRARQKRSVSDLRTIGLAIEAYAVDLAFYPTFPEGPVGGVLVVSLEPYSVKTVPREDGWRVAFRAKSESRFYTVVSFGSDKIPEGGMEDYTPGVSSDYDCDIVYSNGTFVQYPAGVQTH